MAGYKVELLPERIIYFTLFDFKRETVDGWAAYVRKQDGKLVAPVRVIYDLGRAGYPTPYMLDVSVKMMHELQIPEDTRTAYLVGDNIHASFGMVLARRMPKRAGAVRIFVSVEDAKKWLLGLSS